MNDKSNSKDTENEMYLDKTHLNMLKSLTKPLHTASPFNPALAFTDSHIHPPNCTSCFPSQLVTSDFHTKFFKDKIIDVIQSFKKMPAIQQQSDR